MRSTSTPAHLRARQRIEKRMHAEVARHAKEVERHRARMTSLRQEMALVKHEEKVVSGANDPWPNPPPAVVSLIAYKGMGPGSIRRALKGGPPYERYFTSCPGFRNERNRPQFLAELAAAAPEFDAYRISAEYHKNNPS